MGDISISPDWHDSPHQYIHLHIIIGNILTTQRSMGENAFYMVFQESWVFSPESVLVIRHAWRPGFPNFASIFPRVVSFKQIYNVYIYTR